MPILDTKYPGYTVNTDLGVVIGPRGDAVGSPDRHGYIQVCLTHRGLGMPMAHCIIWEAANGAIPEGFEVNHKDGIKSNNRLANLELLTRSGNQRHAYATGLRQATRGERSGMHKLTALDVRSIRSLSAQGQAPHEISALFPVVTLRTIKAVISRERWSHLSDTEEVA